MADTVRCDQCNEDITRQRQVVGHVPDGLDGPDGDYHFCSVKHLVAHFIDAPTTPEPEPEPKHKRTVTRSARSGQWTSPLEAEEHPDETVTETVDG